MRPPTKPLRAPMLPNALDAQVVTNLESRARVEHCRIESCALSDQIAEHVHFDGVRLVGGTLRASKLAQLNLLDVVCERCDLSMVDWPEAKAARVELRGCRLTGGKFVDADLDNVRFVECHLDYASFSRTRFRNVSFESCRLHEADFGAADLDGARFAECELRGADLTGAKLRGADVSTSQLNEIRVGAGDVRGLIVNREQAAVLAQLFGLVVRDR